MTAAMTTTALAGWYGSARMIADAVGEELRGCKLVAVPFAGGMCELARMEARTLLVNDLHRHVIRTARVVADRVWGPQLYRRARRLPFHPGVLAEAQERCRRRDEMAAEVMFPADYDRDLHDPVQSALDYFVCCWMGRGGTAGTPGEFTGGLSVRYDPNGGDSATRFRSATRSLVAWRRVLSRATFTTLDCFDFLARIKDEPGYAIYADPPFAEGGHEYTHTFSDANHRRLAGVLHGYSRARVVVRHYEHDLYAELYPEERWTWRRLVGGKRTNAAAPEVLIINSHDREGGK